MSLNLTELEDVDSNLKIMLSSNDLRQIEVMKKIANLDLSSNFKLRKVVLSNLDKLDLSNNKQIFQLENQNAIFKELKSLVISNTTLKLLKSINISLLVKLKSLDLSYLPLDSITLEKIEYLPNLKEIYLQNCSINTKISFSSLHLEKVDLSHNPFLKHFNGDFLARSSETLILLNLCNVNISEMVNISSFTKLNYLDLSSNLLTRIKNTDIFYNSLLLNLNLSNNLIEVIEMGTFQNQLYLNTIDLRYNRIRNFEDINQPDLFKHLIYLHLTDCQNVSIESMGFFQLEYLDLARNDLTKIPQSDVNSHVFYLYMSENLIENVTNSSLANLRNLKELDLSHNKITTIEPDAFSYFVMIKKIDLSSNKLEYLHPNLLNQLKTIYPLSLNLSNNFLKSIDSEFFVNLRSLEKLDLSFNKIHLIEDDTFVNSAQLKDLYLNHNMNISLSNRTFVGFMLIKNIYLSPDFFDSKDNTNFNSVLDVFDPVQPRNLGSIFYYASIDMIYIPPDSYIYDQDLCNIELKFLANSLHLNLKTETHVKRFWENCEFNFNAIG
jgi:Leucine-rich repeat (LRR) protein